MEKIGETINRQEANQKFIPDQKISEEPGLSKEKVLELLGVNDLNHTFENMRRDGKFLDVYRAFKTMAEGKAKYSMLLVYGGSGNGKTTSCEATVIKMQEKGINVKRDRWSDIVRHLKDLMKTGGYEKYFNDFRSRQRLIIDDVGSGSTGGPWEWGELEDIIDYRYEKNLFTIVTTNLDLKEIPDRIRSRFRDKSKARMVLNEYPDQRPLNEVSR